METGAAEELEYSALFAVTVRRDAPILLNPIVNGVELEMELDTGASLSLASKKTWEGVFHRCSLKKVQHPTENLHRGTTSRVRSDGGQHPVREPGGHATVANRSGEGSCIVGSKLVDIDPIELERHQEGVTGG